MEHVIQNRMARQKLRKYHSTTSLGYSPTETQKTLKETKVRSAFALTITMPAIARSLSLPDSISTLPMSDKQTTRVITITHSDDARSPSIGPFIFTPAASTPVETQTNLSTIKWLRINTYLIDSLQDISGEASVRQQSHNTPAPPKKICHHTF